MRAKGLIGFVMAIAVCGACGDDDSRATTSTTNNGTNNGIKTWRRIMVHQTIHNCRKRWIVSINTNRRSNMI